MSKSQPKIPSSARSAGAVTPRRARARRTLSTASPQSEGSVRLSTVVEKFCKDDFVLSPLKRRSVLPDDTGIEAPRRASWWKRLDGSSRDVLEALDTNKMTDDLLVEEYEFEVEKDKQNQSVPESSDNESVASIVVPQRRLFNQKKQPQGKFVDMGSRKSLGKTNIEDQSIEVAPKTLFNKGPRNKPVFPAALLNSTNKTINKTVEPEPPKQTRPNLFGQAGTKRKNMFADFVLSDSEEDSEVQHKVFDFKKNNNKRISLGTRTRRMPSLTPSMTTEIDIDDWNLLPSSTMIGAQEVSRMSTDDVEQGQEENRDVTLTEENVSIIRDTNNRSNKKSAIKNDENDKTLTNEDIRDASNQEVKMNESIKTNKTHKPSKAKLNESVKNKTIQNKSSTRALEEQQNSAGTKNLINSEPSIEDIMAELHGESIEKEKRRQNVQLDRTKENLEQYKDTKTINYKDGKKKHETEPSSGEQKLQDASKAANNAYQNEDDDLPEKDKSKDELEQIIEEQESQNRPKGVSIINQDKDLHDKSKKGKIEEEMGPSVEDQVIEEHPKEANKTNQEDDIENEKEEETEPSAEEQETRDHSEEASNINQDEDMKGVSEIYKSEEEVEPSANGEDNQHDSNEVSHENEDEEMEDISEKDKSEEEVEPSANGEENHHETTEVSEENEDEEMEDTSEKDKSEEVRHHQESQNDSEEESDENQDEEMEKMVWNDNDDEIASDTSKAGVDAESKQNNKVVPNEKGSESGKNRTIDLKDITNKSKNLPNKSHTIVESFVDNDQMEEEVVEETPNNSTHDTTGRNRKKGTFIKSPEAVLQNMTNDNESFRPIGRSTTFRKSKSLYEMMNRPSLAPVQESTLGSEGSRNSSTEGSEWDSHRTTRKTIRQTFGKEYTTRKSLRALVMEQSAKRQTEIYNKNMSNINKTKNKTVLEGNDKNASKINKTKTVLDDANKTATIVNTKNNSVLEDKNSSTMNKNKNTTILEDVNNKNAATNRTKNKTVLDDVNDQHIRRRTSKSYLSSNQSRVSSMSEHGTSTHHVPDPLIPEHRISHHKSLPEINDPEISHPEDSINVLDNNDSGPEISMNASYGQGMSANTAHEGSVKEHEATDEEMNESPKQIPRNTSISLEEEILDYEASEQEMSESEQENVEQDDSMQQSVQDNESEDLEPEESEKEVEAETDHEESEQENEDSQQEIEAESKQEESQQEIAESDNEESQQEIESEQEESQQEIAESDNEESQQEIESEQEESQQEIESEHETQQEIESEQEIEPASDQESDNEEENDVCEPQSYNESDQENREPERVLDDDFVSGLNSRYHDNRSGVSRVVFDSRMMSIDEIDFEGVSRQTDDDNEGVSTQTDNDYTEHSVREPDLSRNTRISEPSVHDVSVGTKKSLLLMQMQKIAQLNMELRQKIINQVDKSLKPPRSCNIMSPVRKYCIRRITKEPKRPTKKPTRKGVAMETLPKAFVEDLKYKPPKRFHKADAPWITKRLYKFLETKLEPRYDYRARVRAEELVETIYNFSKLVWRRDVAPPQAVDELKREMARLRVVNTHFEFYDFFDEFMPREVRIKVNPDVINKIPLPRNGIFGEILQYRTADAVE